MFEKRQTGSSEVRDGLSDSQEDGDNDYDDSIAVMLDAFDVSDEDEDNPREVGNDEFGDSTTKNNKKPIIQFSKISDILSVFRMIYLLSILHLGCVWMRLPVLMSDIHR
ncbi:7727_t:CDS:1 [Acaulospora colombiana]|uniref:7727_t:CDS:1 n=1 Tax=Acaulospora colombiana TaxID=27376 RepID=A0ACA9N115_9GLOM|nr:7727_t:CDS:1 [Acaulospora colombiana]